MSVDSTAPSAPTALAEPAVELVRDWLRQTEGVTPDASATRLAGLLQDPLGLEFALGFVDRVARPDDPGARALVQRSTAGAAGRAALACFGVHDAPTLHGHGMVAVSDRITLDALALDDSRYWTRRGYRAPQG